jgi:hypothetical protein
MTEKEFTKRLTANDTGESGAHQAGIHVPKGEKELIAFLPHLDTSIKNPDTWLSCIDPDGREWAFRYIFYNNKLHDPGGTRDEYRITHMTKFFRVFGALEGDSFRISGKEGTSEYQIRVERADAQDPLLVEGKIKLTGWRRVH